MTYTFHGFFASNQILTDMSNAQQNHPVVLHVNDNAKLYQIIIRKEPV